MRLVILLAIISIILHATMDASAASGSPGTVIHGTVRDLDGNAVKDACVAVAGTIGRTSPDASGNFTIEAPSATPVRLLFEHPDYYPESLEWHPGDATTVEVVLTPRTVLKQNLNVVASRLDIPYRVNPAATSVVDMQVLEQMPRAIAADEALALVPGLKVDNQADGERVHLSIRGQGILSERGIRGIQVLYDGIPLNDPSGFCPDLYDVDWGGVQEINVVRGPVAFLYGGGSAGGVIDITTRFSEYPATHGGVEASGGSHGFYKTRGEVAGGAGRVYYLFSGSRTAADGYREHTAFWGNNAYGRLGIHVTPRLRLTPFIMGVGFFNENAEGLNVDWIRRYGIRIANPDAVAFNEYQRTLRLTAGTTGEWAATARQRVSFTFYTRRTGYLEPVPSSVEHRSLTAPGGSLQYEVDGKAGGVRHHFGAGVDLDGQFVSDFRRPNLGNAVEGAALVANQDITQKRTGAYVTDRIGLGERWTLLAGARIDRISNRNEDVLKAGGLDLSGSRVFQKATARAGITYDTAKNISLYASWGQGFLPPATEELYANPAALGGFNTALAPSASSGGEAGARGNIRNHFFFDAALFHLNTTNDFERYRIHDRPLETFYANAGRSSRWGLETSARWLPVRRVVLSTAYTASHFVYTEYTSNTYPGDLVGHRLPNSPVYQGTADASLEFARNSFLQLRAMAFSRAYVDPTNTAWIGGYALLNARISKTWRRGMRTGTLFLAGTNLTGKQYIAFTEPDPDGNSYHPGATREFFAGLQFRF